MRDPAANRIDECSTWNHDERPTLTLPHGKTRANRSQVRATFAPPRAAPNTQPSATPDKTCGGAFYTDHPDERQIDGWIARRRRALSGTWRLVQAPQYGCGMPGYL
jgi:hypothetical protein